MRQLEQAFPHLLTPTQASAYDTVAFAQNEEIRDLQSVIKASRALSEEINLERLIEILMTIVLERAGAQRGLLIRVSENHAPEMEASATTCADGVRVRILRDVPLADDLPLSVLSAVIRTGQEIRTGNPETFHPFSQDPYLVASGAAVMCVPMFKQARLVGVLYLENRLVPDVFTAGHSRVVSLLEILMTIVLERAGAQRGLLIRVSENHAPEMEASATTCADGVRVRILRDVPLADDLPLSVLSAVIRTGQEIRTGNPETFHPFSQDPYLVASGAAVMCVPMFKQARLVGVLYLENRLVPDVFTAGHSRVVCAPARPR
ncbi:Signal transduction histidine kinase CheA [Cronobacter dublinensis 582]|nr:Signal transduction histidine kinase CheA [Cronobacter dublinensis 582]